MQLEHTILTSGTPNDIEEGWWLLRTMDVWGTGADIDYDVFSVCPDGEAIPGNNYGNYFIRPAIWIKY